MYIYNTFYEADLSHDNNEGRVYVYMGISIEVEIFHGAREVLET